MTKKAQSLFLIFMIYLFAMTMGVLTYLTLNIESMIGSILIANIVTTFIVFIFGLGLKNASLYDPYWSVIPPFITIGLSILWGRFFDLEVLLLNLAILIWAIRLTYNWAKLWTDFSHQDWRYEMIKEKTHKLWPIANFLAIHLFPTLIVFVQLIGAIIYIEYVQNITWLSFLGFVLIIFATYIQFKSDQQMQIFKKEHPKKVMNKGLWQYSRHPNYFGEVTVWIGVYLFYLSVGMTLNILIFAPLAMLMLFVFISIPMMEKRQIKSKPEYVEYISDVSMLVPLPFKFTHLFKKPETS